MFKKYIFLGLLVLNLRCSSGLPTGAPVKACATMTPQHDNYEKQSIAAPYEVKVEAGPSTGEVTVTLRNTTAAPFIGFILRAVNSNNDQETVGKFVELPKTAKTLTCNSTDDNVTHNSKDAKFEQQFLWKTTTTGITVVFRATFVQTYETFWVDVRSDPIKI